MSVNLPIIEKVAGKVFVCSKGVDPVKIECASETIATQIAHQVKMLAITLGKKLDKTV
ncbi:MAG TPA: hypothetical protein PLG15_02710 [Candidatus Gastranaerophilaceae bacterium]|nr:hypothetical protein [Candidatus Gastranaerophilaceae bacterium]HPT41275.1 hypothetical protein [Candidatus Gastranaerophilaceae bacterium]